MNSELLYIMFYNLLYELTTQRLQNIELSSIQSEIYTIEAECIIVYLLAIIVIAGFDSWLLME